MYASDFFCIYVSVVPLKDKRGITIVNAFQKIIPKGCKPNKILVDQRGEFHNNLFKRFLKINSTEMYSTYNEGTWKKKIFKQWELFQKLFILMLDNGVNKYNNSS